MIEFVTIDRSAELDRFVENHPNGHFMQTGAWGRVKREWPWMGLILRDPDGTIRGTVSLLRHDLRFIHNCLYYSPRGPVFTRGDDRTFLELIRAAACWARSRGAYLLRIDPEIESDDAPFTELIRREGFLVNQASDFSLFQPRLCYVSSLAGKDEQTLAAMYHRSTRYNIRKALRGPLTVRLGGTEDLPVFCRMMGKTAAKNSFTPKPQAFFQAFLECLAPYARLYMAELNDRPIAASISVFFGNTCSVCFCCSEEAGDKLHANELLQWHMQTDAIAQGCQRFDFRGVEGQPVETNPYYGLHRYKQGFGAEFCAWIGQLDLPLRPALYRVASCLSGLRLS